MGGFHQGRPIGPYEERRTLPLQDAFNDANRTRRGPLGLCLALHWALGPVINHYEATILTLSLGGQRNSRDLRGGEEIEMPIPHRPHSSLQAALWLREEWLER